jgi:hypothetical protein
MSIRYLQVFSCQIPNKTMKNESNPLPKFQRAHVAGRVWGLKEAVASEPKTKRRDVVNIAPLLVEIFC